MDRALATTAAGTNTERRGLGRALPFFGGTGALAVAALTFLCLLVVASPAHALKGSFAFGSAGDEGGQFNTPRDVAVYVGVDGDASTDKVFVVDEQNWRIQRFALDGTFEQAWGQDVVEDGGSGDTVDDGYEICAVAAECKAGVPGGIGGAFGEGDSFGSPVGSGPTGVAVNQSTGQVYVLDRHNRRVQQFDTAGGFVRAWGWDVVQPGGTGDTVDGSFEICTVGSECAQGASGGGDGQFGVPYPFSTNAGGIAVHPDTGDVLAVDAPDGATSRIQQFSSEGFFVAAFDGFGSAGAETGHVAVDSLDVLYGDDRRYDLTAGGFLSEVGGSNSITGLEVDPDTDGAGPDVERLFRAIADQGIEEFDVSVEPPVLSETHVPGWGVFVNGLGVNVSDGSVYVSTSGNRVAVLTEAGAPPAIAIPSGASGVGAHSATLEGSVNPNGVGVPVSYRFEYSENGVDWTAAGPDVELGEGTTPIPVSVGVDGLEANTFYRVRIVTTKAYGNDPVGSAEATFVTDRVAPEVETGGAQRVTSGSAQVRGRINPNNLATTYHVEYGKTTSYGSRIPVPAGDAGDGGVERLFVEQLTGLEAGKTYHFRFVATNAAGTTFGQDGEFTTRAVLSPGGDRVYEMVTPPDKSNRRGGDMRPADAPQVGVPSADGEAFLFASQFSVMDGDAGIAMPNTYNPVLYDRHSDGWRGSGLVNIAPQGPSVSGVINPSGLSPDLSVQGWQVDEWLFPSTSQHGTRVFGDTGGQGGSGWYDWIADPAVIANFDTSGLESALLTEGGETMVRWGGPGTTYRGLLGPGDPSLTQVAGEDGGDAIYRQAPAGSGPRELVNECTGTIAGGDATEVPMVDDKGTVAAAAGANGIVMTAVGSSQVTVLGMISGTYGPGQRVQPGGAGNRFPANTTVLSRADNVVTLSAAATVAGGPATMATVPDPAALADDEIVGRDCETGSVTSTLGAAVGGGDVAGPVGGTVRNGLSADGRRMFFLSPDPQPRATGDARVPSACEGTGTTTSCPPQLFVRQYDTNGGSVVRWISRSTVPDQHARLLGRGVGYEGASRDGDTVYFRTNAPLTADDPSGTGAPGPVTASAAVANLNRSWDLYRYDLPAGNGADPADGMLTRVSGGPDVEAGETAHDPNVLDPSAGGSALRFLSDDGEKAYFVTRGVIGSPDADWNETPDGGLAGPEGTFASTQTRNLYLYDASKAGDERWKFVTNLPATGDERRIPACATRATQSGMPQQPVSIIGGETVHGRNAVSCVRGTPDGETIAFESPAQLTSDDDDQASDIYLYDAADDELARVSAPRDDSPAPVCGEVDADTDAFCNATFGQNEPVLGSVGYDRVGLNGVVNQNLAVDGDGGVSLFFESTLALVDEDDDGGLMDVYEWRAGELSLVSPATGDDAASFSGNSRDGEDVFFSTAARIDPREIDEDFDIYDARVGGGIPLPPDPREPCSVQDGSCHDAVGGSRLGIAPRSNGTGGGGDAVLGDRASISIARPGARALRRARRSGTIALRVRASSAGTVRVVGRARIAGEQRTVGSARRRFTQAGAATVRLRLNGVAKRHIRSGRGLRLRVRVATVVRGRGV